MYVIQSWVNGDGCDSWSFEDRSVAEAEFKALAEGLAREMWKENRTAVIKLKDSEVWGYSLYETHEDEDEDGYDVTLEDLDYASLSWKQAKERLGHD